MAVELEAENITPENSPFRVRLNFTLSEKIQMLLCFIFVVPIRFIVCFIALVLAWLGSCIGLMGMDVDKPISGWRTPLRGVVGFLGKVCCMCVGFQFVDIKGRRATKDEAPVLVVAPHSTFFDALAIFWSDLPFIASIVENKNITFIGKCIQFSQAIFVERDNRENRSMAVSEIKKRTQSDDSWNQFLIFPEGTTSNRKALFSYKPGGFLPGKPVQPVLMRYKMKHDTVSWTWDQPHGFIMVFLYTICQWDNPVQLEYLEPYIPSEEEKADPVLFANNVRDVMADALKVPVCNMTYADVKDLFAKSKKNKKAE
jgi:lysophosphatidylcholine acyltransferase/lyso-PAF acetyltransferase